MGTLGGNGWDNRSTLLFTHLLGLGSIGVYGGRTTGGRCLANESINALCPGLLATLTSRGKFGIGWGLETENAMMKASPKVIH